VGARPVIAGLALALAVVAPPVAARQAPPGTPALEIMVGRGPAPAGDGLLLGAGASLAVGRGRALALRVGL
jgi:hypothetical protein